MCIFDFYLGIPLCAVIMVIDDLISYVFMLQSFIRHDTPHPKELKARHPKLGKKNVDGHVISHSDEVI